MLHAASVSALTCRRQGGLLGACQHPRVNRDSTNPGERVAWAIDHSGRTAKALAEEMGVSHATLSQWRHAETTLFNAKVGNVARFCELTKVNMQWLLTGDGPREIVSSYAQEPDLVTQARHFVHDLPPSMAATAYRLLAALEGQQAEEQL